MRPKIKKANFTLSTSGGWTLNNLFISIKISKVLTSSSQTWITLTSHFIIALKYCFLSSVNSLSKSSGSPSRHILSNVLIVVV